MTRQESTTQFLLQMAAECWACAQYCPSEAEIGDEYLAAAEAIASGADEGKKYLAAIAELGEGDHSAPATETAPKRRRTPSIRTLIRQAEKAGKPVSSLTTPDGITLRFGEVDASKPASDWDEVLRREPH
jgi:hypothetical protein